MFPVTVSLSSWIGDAADGQGTAYHVVSITTLTTLRWPSNKFILKGYDIHSNMVTLNKIQKSHSFMYVSNYTLDYFSST